MYIVLYIITAVSSLSGFVNGKGRTVYHFLLVCSFFLIGITFLFKYGVIDYYSYERIYHGIEGWEKWEGLTYLVDSNTPIEPGFALLIYVEKYFFGNFYFFIGFFSLWAFLIKFYVLKKLSPYLAISLFLYVCDLSFFNDLERVRSGMAASFVFLSFFFVYRNRNVLSLISIFLAASFHYVAFLAFFILFFRKLSNHLILTSIFIFSLLIALYGGIGKDISIFLSQLLLLGVDSRLTSHIEGKYGVASNLFSGTYIYLISVAFFVLYRYRELINKVDCNSVFIPVYIISLSVSLILIDYSIVSSRVWQVYCLPALLVIVPSLLKVFNKNSKTFVFLFIVFFYSFLFYLYSSQRDNFVFVFSVI